MHPLHSCVNFHYLIVPINHFPTISPHLFVIIDSNPSN